MRNAWRISLLCLAALWWPFLARADEPSNASSARERWQKMSEAERQAARERYREFVSLPVSQRKILVQRYQQFIRMPEIDKQRMRQRYRDFKRLPPREQQMAREAFNRFRTMSPERKARLRQLFVEMLRMTSSDRQHYLVKLQRWFQLNAEQRTRLLNQLKELRNRAIPPPIIPP
jgi:hypothetical protein